MIRIAVIGGGHWGRNHIRVFSNLPGVEIVAVADSDRRSLARVRELFPGITCQPDPDQVLGQAGVDAVIIATPTSTHYALAREAIVSGKHVLCEKPLCPRAADARELVALAQARGLVLMVGHVFLFNAGLARVKELIAGDELGRLYYLAATRTNLGPIRSDVNAAYDLASHDIAIFNWLLDAQPEVLSASGAAFLQPGIEDVVFISLRYRGDVFAHILASWLNPKKVRQVSVVGSRKMVTWDDLELNTPVAVYDRGARATPQPIDYGEFLRASTWDSDVRLLKVRLEEPLKVQNRYFLDAIREARIDRSDGVFALQVVETLEAIAAALGRDTHDGPSPDPAVAGATRERYR